MTSLVLAGDSKPRDSESDEQPIPQQVWIADQVQCPIDPQESWASQLWKLHEKIPEGQLIPPIALENPQPQFPSPESYPEAIPSFVIVINPSGNVERIGLLNDVDGPIVDVFTGALQKHRYEPAKIGGEAVCFAVYIVPRIEPR
jgi:hypothetical protein